MARSKLKARWRLPAAILLAIPVVLKPREHPEELVRFLRRTIHYCSNELIRWTVAVELDVMNNQLGYHIFRVFRRKPDVGATASQTVRTEPAVVLSGREERLPRAGDMTAQAFHESVINGTNRERMFLPEPAHSSHLRAKVNLALCCKIGVIHACYDGQRSSATMSGAHGRSKFRLM